MTSFKAMTVATEGIVKLFKLHAKDRYLSYLPVAHGMERYLGEVRYSKHQHASSFFKLKLIFDLHTPNCYISFCVKLPIAIVRPIDYGKQPFLCRVPCHLCC
jgi:hypothetical protein